MKTYDTTDLPYVIVRCKDAGVHAGYLVKAKGRKAVMTQARRLWYFRVPMGSPAFLSGVALDGLADECKVGAPINVTLTETCEIIECTEKARKSIVGYESHARTK